MTYEDEWKRRAKKGGNVARAERAATMERIRGEQDQTRAEADEETLAATTTETVETAGKKPAKPEKFKKFAAKRADKKDD